MVTNKPRSKLNREKIEEFLFMIICKSAKGEGVIFHLEVIVLLPRRIRECIYQFFTWLTSRKDAESFHNQRKLPLVKKQRFSMWTCFFPFWISIQSNVNYDSLSTVGASSKYLPRRSERYFQLKSNYMHRVNLLRTIINVWVAFRSFFIRE